MLSRESVKSGEFYSSFSSAPAIRWSQKKIKESLLSTLESRPSPGPVWLFAYGSLIWNPLLRFEERRLASLAGFRRSFCLSSILGRGDPETPGRMLSLEPGGMTRGVCYRLSDECLVEELELLWVREMITGAYVPTWVSLALDAEDSVWGLTFVANTSHVLYVADVDPVTVGPIAAVAKGALGSNSEYVCDLQKALLACNIVDPYVDEVVTAMSVVGQRQALGQSKSGLPDAA
ncbi:gamma-glutamylcyclotransferase [Cupriavidus sp. IDO]|uniref:gamma-glutamylcyclotransferase n=1 Tax=Cupriavidus sp. IDO TaxID=1539142 RepID=UPI000578EA26|nr:gamma-glutamylcyclotransferase [Cupriavidus sp. IDO]